MKQLKMIKAGNLKTSLNPWKAMPKQSKTPDGYSLQVNGAALKSPEVQLTGGGAFPAYTYINHGGELFWFAGHFDAGTAVEIIDPTPAAKSEAEAKPEAKGNKKAK